jgi:uncharacterized protein YfaT (DUF1175 family)
VKRIAVFLLVLILVACAVVVLFVSWRYRRPERLVISSREGRAPADGARHRVAEVRLSRGGRLAVDEIAITGIAGSVLADGERKGTVVVMSLVNPGRKHISLRYHGSSVDLLVEFVPNYNDTYGDGTPDFLRLHMTSDRSAFRAWFTTLADEAAVIPRERVPKEIGDCAALLRWCYRGALHAHDDAGQATMPMDAPPPLASVAQYSYPFTPLGANLFRVRSGPFAASDLADGGFAQFADAKTLWLHNTFFVSRDLRSARPGDMLFYRQLEQNSPFHSMILTGVNHEWVVYHTGSIGSGPGEVRRVTVEDLMHHPDARWRPIPENNNFLGVYRWDILREDHR